MTTLHITVPDELAQTLGQSEAALSQLAYEAMVVRLYALGHISAGKGAELLGISRRDALDLIGQYGLSVFDETMDIAEEARSAHDASRFQHQPTD